LLIIIIFLEGFRNNNPSGKKLILYEQVIVKQLSGYCKKLVLIKEKAAFNSLTYGLLRESCLYVIAGNYSVIQLRKSNTLGVENNYLFVIKIS